MVFRILIFASIISLTNACKKDAATLTTSTDTVINVDAANFLTSTGSVTITTENRTLSNGTTATCYKIVTKITRQTMPWVHGALPISPMMPARVVYG